MRSGAFFSSRARERGFLVSEVVDSRATPRCMSVRDRWPGSGVHADSQVFTLPPAARSRSLSCYVSLRSCYCLAHARCVKRAPATCFPSEVRRRGFVAGNETAPPSRARAYCSENSRCRRLGGVLRGSNKHVPIGAGKLPIPAAPRPRTALPLRSTFCALRGACDRAAWMPPHP